MTELEKARHVLIIEDEILVAFEVEALLAGLRPLLDASSGVMFGTETFVSRPEYFS